MTILNHVSPVKSAVRTRVTPMVLQTQKAQELKTSILVDPLMLLSEAQPMLGNPSYTTLRKWIKDGSLHVWRAGRGHYRIRLSEVERFRAAGEVRP